MSRQRDIDRVLEKIPSGRVPPEFAAFVAAKPDVTIHYTRPTDLEFLPSAAAELVPFIDTGDGSVIAFWFTVDPAAVVLIDAHGEPPKVLAIDFLNFLREASLDKPSGLGFEEYCDGLKGTSVAGVVGRPSRKGVARLQKEFLQWARTHSALLEPDLSPEGQLLRSRIIAVCSQMIADGMCKVYRQPNAHWIMDFKIVRRRQGLEIKHLTYGKWYDVPQSCSFHGLVRELLAHSGVKKPGYELSVTSDGLVSLDHDKSLVLVP